VVLGCYIVQGLRSAAMVLKYSLSIVNGLQGSYYFSTHGCRRVLSGCGADLDELAATAASF